MMVRFLVTRSSRTLKGLLRNRGRAFSNRSKSSSVNTDSVLLAARKQIVKTPKSAGTRNNGGRRKLNVRKLSTRINGTAEKRERTTAFDNPFVTGACRTLRMDSQARSIMVIASSALPMAPAVVPRVEAPKPTAVRSMMVAARLIPRIWVVFPMAWRAVIRSRL